VAKRLDGSGYHLVRRYRRHCQRQRPLTTTEIQQPPLFGPLLLWPNGRPSEQLLSSCSYTIRCCCVYQRSGASRMCVFRETLSTNHFTELQSVSDATWRVGFKRNGRPMSARRGVEPRRRRRRRRQRCFQFLKHGAEKILDWRRRRPHPVPFGRVDHQQIIKPRLQRRRRRRRRV